jgi:hypothetical protein
MCLREIEVSWKTSATGGWSGAYLSQSSHAWEPPG